jgi:hypothetical protein
MDGPAYPWRSVEDYEAWLTDQLGAALLPD